ncbi:MAG: hypothetical protein WCH74_13340 [Chloroflexota bacterium]
MSAPAAGGLEIGLQVWTLRDLMATARASYSGLRHPIGPPPVPEH